MKGWLTSKTFWFNILALVATVAASFGYTGELSAEWDKYAAVIVMIINIILRFFTKTSLSVAPIVKKDPASSK